MENRLIWHDRYNLGIDIIDDEHKKLFRILNKLFAFGEDEEKSQWVCQEGIKYFKDHTVKHFADEEAYMESVNYPGLPMHRRIHADFRDNTIPLLQKELEENEYSEASVSHFLGVCTGWLLGHTLTEDQAIVGRGKSRWADLLSVEDSADLKQAILQQLYDMFQLDATVVSESYSGEKFGNGIYYRIVYSNDQKKKFETILVFEESLLINTIGQILGVKTDKISVLLLNTMRYTARQFVKCIMEHFSAAEGFEQKSENLLSYEQFTRLLEREDPQFSMLFNTGKGYFAYCVIAPHLNESGIGTNLNAETALTEIENYLKKNEAEHKKARNKKKILMVDDSITMIRAIQTLLKDSYDVSVANSGMSAISNLTLNRPDLILLDYEMPVCDGKLILEMIRAEENFANIAVIFLTGRVDQKSVKEVLALKPAGYLSKSLSAPEIKKYIDQYFEQVEAARRGAAIRKK